MTYWFQIITTQLEVYHKTTIIAPLLKCVMLSDDNAHEVLGLDPASLVLYEWFGYAFESQSSVRPLQSSPHIVYLIS
ncbi:MAG: hypothetical protein K8I82_32370 [Anaerolineae bacterium]|nr:hypothetical protein [Anaerolineae bacterium]